MDPISGSASIRRVGRFAFPVYVLVQEDGTNNGRILARLGRRGWLRIFFGPGQRVELPDGTKSRVAAVEASPYIEPAVLGGGGKLVVGSPHGKRSYRITGRDFAFRFYAAGDARRGKDLWTLQEHETVIATFQANLMSARHSVPLPAALLCFTLITYGIPGEADLGIPEFRWA